MHNEIDSIIDPGVRELEVITIDAVVYPAGCEIHDKPPLAWPLAFRDDTKSADMEGRTLPSGLREKSTRP